MKFSFCFFSYGGSGFIEIDDNVMYVEREDEFESEKSDEGDLMDLDDYLISIEPLTSK